MKFLVGFFFSVVVGQLGKNGNIFYLGFTVVVRRADTDRTVPTINAIFVYFCSAGFAFDEFVYLSLNPPP